MADPDDLTPRQRALVESGLGTLSQIAGRLYAGGAPVHSTAPLKVTWEMLRARGVDTVFSLTDREEERVPDWVTREVYALSDTADLAESGATLGYLKRVVARIDRALAEGRCVYVHCLAGVSRTGLVLTAWEMNRARQGPGLALQALREKRPCLQPNSGFLALLEQWEAKLGR